jgi:hypothetical protein
VLGLYLVRRAVDHPIEPRSDVHRTSANECPATSLRIGSLPLVPDEVPADLPDDSDDDPKALTRGLERLRESMEKLRHNITSKVDFSPITGMAKIQADIEKSVRFKFPEGLIKSPRDVSAAASKVYVPLFASQATWDKQFPAINSDYFKIHAANQTEFAKLSAQLTKNVDFGLSTSLSSDDRAVRRTTIALA